MAENRRGKENRFYFSRGQLVLLGGAFILASVVIFFIGMFVGKGIEERKILKREEPLVKIPVKPTPQGSSGALAAPPKEEITFNESVAKSPTAPLAGEKVKEEKPAEKMAHLEAKQNKAPVKAETPAVDSPEKKVDKSVPAEAPVKPTAATETAAPKDNGKMWRAQVNAYPDERSAKQIVDRLKNKGYNAYVTEAQNKGKTWYRVNVGKYGSRDEADRIVEVLKSKENFTKAFAASK